MYGNFGNWKFSKNSLKKNPPKWYSIVPTCEMPCAACLNDGGWIQRHHFTLSSLVVFFPSLLKLRTRKHRNQQTLLYFLHLFSFLQTYKHKHLFLSIIFLFHFETKTSILLSFPSFFQESVTIPSWNKRNKESPPAPLLHQI